MAFDPDDFLRDSDPTVPVQPASPKNAFDPDAFLQGTGVEPPVDGPAPKLPAAVELIPGTNLYERTKPRAERPSRAEWLINPSTALTKYGRAAISDMFTADDHSGLSTTEKLARVRDTMGQAAIKAVGDIARSYGDGLLPDFKLSELGALDPAKLAEMQGDKSARRGQLDRQAAKEWGDEVSEGRAEAIEALRFPAEKGGAWHVAQDAAESVGANAMPLITTIVTRSPAIGAVLMGATSSQQGFDEATAAGYEPEDARRVGQLYGLITGSTVMLPFSFINKMGGKPLVQAVAGFVARDVPQDIGEFALQQMVAKLEHNPEMTWGDFWDGLKHTVKVSAVASPVMGGAVKGSQMAGSGAKKAAKVTGEGIKKAGKAASDAVYKAPDLQDAFTEGLAPPKPDPKTRMADDGVPKEIAENRQGERRKEVVEPAKPYTYTKLDAAKGVKDRALYHGTKAPIESLQNADPAVHGRVDSLFGIGLYLSDNPSIGKAYAKGKGKGPEGEVFSAKLGDANVVDLDAPLPPDVRAVFDRIVVDGQTGRQGQTGVEVFESLKEQMADAEFSNTRALEVYQDLAATLKGAGYDGFTHTGGLRVKNDLGEHNVVILFPDFGVGKPLTELLTPGPKVVTSEKRQGERRGEPRRLEDKTAPETDRRQRTKYPEAPTEFVEPLRGKEMIQNQIERDGKPRLVRMTSDRATLFMGLDNKARSVASDKSVYVGQVSGGMPEAKLIASREVPSGEGIILEFRPDALIGTKTHDGFDDIAKLEKNSIVAARAQGRDFSPEMKARLKEQGYVPDPEVPGRMVRSDWSAERRGETADRRSKPAEPARDEKRGAEERADKKKRDEEAAEMRKRPDFDSLDDAKQIETLSLNEKSGLPSGHVYDGKVRTDTIRPSDVHHLGGGKFALGKNTAVGTPEGWLKWVNDNIGHDKGGDVVLKHYGDAFRYAKERGAKNEAETRAFAEEYLNNIPLELNGKKYRFRLADDTLSERPRSDLPPVERMSRKQRAEVFYTHSGSGLPNRNRFNQRLAQGKLGRFVASTDVNGLKKINDTYGQKVGDDIIAEVGEAMRRFVDDPYNFQGDEGAATHDNDVLLKEQLDAANLWLRNNPYWVRTKGKRRVAIRAEFGYAIDKSYQSADAKLTEAKDATKTPEERKQTRAVEPDAWGHSDQPVGPIQTGEQGTDGESSRSSGGEDGNSSEVTGKPPEGSTGPGGQFPGLPGQTPTVPLFSLRYIFEGAAETLERTPGLQDVGKAVKQYTDRHADLQGQINRILDPAMKAFGKWDWKKPTKIWAENRAAEAKFAEWARAWGTSEADGKAVYDAMDPKVQALADAWVKIADLTGTLNQKANVEVFDPELASHRPIGKIKNFFPRMTKPEYQKAIDNPAKHPKEWGEVVDMMIADGRVQNDAEARDYFAKERARPSSITKDYFAGMEQARTQGLPEGMYDFRPIRAMEYLSKWSDRLAQIEAFGQRHKGGGDLFDNAVRRLARDDRATDDYLRAIQQQVYKDATRGLGPKTAAVLNQVATGLMLGNPGTATLNLIGGTTLNHMAYGRAAVKAYAALLNPRKLKELRIEARDLGVDVGDFMQLMADTDGLTPQWLSKGTSTLMKIGLYTPTERVIRFHALATGKIKLQDALKLWRETGFAKGRGKEEAVWFSRNGFDPATLVNEMGIVNESGSRGGPETDRFLRYAVNLTQGSYKLDQVPLWSDRNMGRFLAKFQKFGTQLARMFEKNHAAPLHKALATKKGEVVKAIDPKTGKSVEVKNPRARAVVSMVNYLGWAALGGTASMLARGALFGAATSGPDWDEIERVLENGDKAKAVSLGLQLAFEGILANGGIGIIQQPAIAFRDYADRRRTPDPTNPPAINIINETAKLFSRVADQGKLTAKDLDHYAERVGSIYRTAKRATLVGLDASGVDLDVAQLERARRDAQFVRKLTRRYASESALPVRRRRPGGNLQVTPMTPVNAEILDALSLGRPGQAQAALKRHLDTIENERDVERAIQSARSAVRARQPTMVADDASNDGRLRFLQWAEKNLTREEFNRVKAIDSTYRQAADAAGLMDAARDPVLREGREGGRLEPDRRRRLYRQFGL